MKLLSLYEAVNKILSRLDFSRLYSHFSKYRFALYNHTEICLDGKIIPYDQRFLANTSILYEGDYIAIWNVAPEQQASLDAELLAYGIVHEMFHCFQLQQGEERFPDDLKLLVYPSDPAHYAAKYQENQYLIDAFSGCNIESLVRFSEIRNARLAGYGGLTEELKAETIEGVAEYVGLKALKIINEEKYWKITLDYVDKLKNNLDLLFDIRRISYYTGPLFCLTLEMLGLPVRNEFHGLPVYRQNIPFPSVSAEAAAPNTALLTEVTNRFQALTKRRQSILSTHMAQSTCVEYPAFICGYDPMNMFQVENLLYCSHFVFLQKGAETIKKEGPILLMLKEDSDREIAGYYELSQ
ncbi:hypothetical protein NSB25_13325 [Acetatifactor muris]|uniref:Uncharacterized protein n=1 Tax=Acetatifactor muris TaxID=879566 RepID=A0A2K4ZHL4_9FIRM|nr:hypothetical protein [Acetatifactor muris]MCR2048269.1 hypothetical protein [Acetatifactor muris]SOY29967.1 hypothetical protein AMURIS_02688 [Acetatifactor muris]